MRGAVPHAAGDLNLVLDLFGPQLVGRDLLLQVLQSGRPMRRVTTTRPFRDWFVVRVTDPAQPADGRADPFPDYRSAGRAVAYASPWGFA